MMVIIVIITMIIIIIRESELHVSTPKACTPGSQVPKGNDLGSAQPSGLSLRAPVTQICTPCLPEHTPAWGAGCPGPPIPKSPSPKAGAAPSIPPQTCRTPMQATGDGGEATIPFQVSFPPGFPPPPPLPPPPGLQQLTVSVPS